MKTQPHIVVNYLYKQEIDDIYIYRDQVDLWICQTFPPPIFPILWYPTRVATVQHIQISK